MNLKEELRNTKYYVDIYDTYINKNKTLDLDMTISELINKMSNKTYWNIPRKVDIPKSNGGTRSIFIFDEEDSFILKVINEIFLEKNRDKIEINSFAYKKGVRCYDAAKYVQSNMKSKTCHAMKIDISNYFQSVPLTVIKSCIDDLVEDSWGRDLLYKLFEIDSVMYKGKVVKEYLGIMPGSALSAFFANYVLSNIDRRMTSASDLYARYSDDIMIMSDSEEGLENLYKIFIYELEKIGLSVKKEKVKYYINEPVITDFLSLDIGRTFIDVNEKYYKKLRGLIRTECDKSRKKIEDQYVKNKVKPSNDTISVILSNTINSVYKKLYKSMVSDKMEHKGGRLQYVFGNITKSDKLKELDYYMLDTLRYVVSGKHNKGLVSRYDTSYMERIGFISFAKMFNIYRNNPQECLAEVSLLLNSRPNVIHSTFSTEGGSRLKESFNEIYLKLMEIGGSIILDKDYSVNEIIFDIKSNCIRVGNFVLVRGNKVVSKFYLRLSGNVRLIDIVGTKAFKTCPELDRYSLFDMYLNASCRADFSFSGNVKHYMPFPFKTNIISKVDEEYPSIVDTDEPYINRYSAFMYCIYSMCKLGKIPYDKESKNYVILSNKNYPLYISRNWLGND